MDKCRENLGLCPQVGRLVSPCTVFVFPESAAALTTDTIRFAPLHFRRRSLLWKNLRLCVFRTYSWLWEKWGSAFYTTLILALVRPLATGQHTLRCAHRQGAPSVLWHPQRYAFKNWGHVLKLAFTPTWAEKRSIAHPHFPTFPTPFPFVRHSRWRNGLRDPGDAD